jgi:hypothetical protein
MPRTKRSTNHSPAASAVGMADGQSLSPHGELPGVCAFPVEPSDRSRIARVHACSGSEPADILPVALLNVAELKATETGIGLDDRRINSQLPAARKTMLTVRAQHLGMEGFENVHRQAASENSEDRMVGCLLRETVSEEPSDGQAVGAARGNAALAADSFKEAHDEHAHEDGRIHRRTSARAALQPVMRAADQVHRRRETHLRQRRRELRVERIMRPGDDFLRAQPEILLEQAWCPCGRISREVIAAPSSHARKTCRAGGFQQAPKSSGGHQLISKIYFKTI